MDFAFPMEMEMQNLFAKGRYSIDGGLLKQNCFHLSYIVFSCLLTVTLPITVCISHWVNLNYFTVYAYFLRCCRFCPKTNQMFLCLYALTLIYHMTSRLGVK